MGEVGETLADLNGQDRGVHLKNIWHNRESSRGPCSRGFSVKRVKLQMSLVLRVEETFRHPKPWVGIKIERVGARVREWEWQHQLKRTLKTWHRNSCIISTLCLREASRTSTLIFLFQNNWNFWTCYNSDTIMFNKVCNLCKLHSDNILVLEWI